MKRPWLRFLVPRDWSGEQALTAAALLQEAQDSLWDIHGEAMAGSLGSSPRERWAEVLPEVEDDKSARHRTAPRGSELGCARR